MSDLTFVVLKNTAGNKNIIKKANNTKKKLYQQK